MLKEQSSLRNFRNKFTEVVIFGSGPTKLDYEVELPKITEPIFFINDTHRMSHLCCSEHQYFFTHHISEFTRVDPVTVFIQRMFSKSNDYQGVLKATATPINSYISIDVQLDDDVVSDRFLDAFKLRDKDEIERKNRLLACFGSATTAIHFAWFSGCNKITFIGCNPDLDTFSYDPRIISDSGTKMLSSPSKVKENNRILPRMLGLNVVHK
jgi:hypothetical protein